MRLAAIQYKPPKGRVAQARQELVTLVEAAGQEGAQIIVAPEMATTGYVWSSPQEIAPHTEPARGPTLEALAPLAQKFGAWIVCGFAERFVHPQGHLPPERRRNLASLYNSALVINPEGELATCYRKVLLYTADTTWANAGTRRPLCPTSLGTLTPAICMDVNDDELIRFLVETSPDFLAFCTNWVEEGEAVHAYWRNRLAPWRGWTIAANTWGTDRGTRFSGRSAIFDPDGKVVTEAGPEGNAVIVAEVDGPPQRLTHTPADA
jgi:predicted amidohydrolase